MNIMTMKKKLLSLLASLRGAASEWARSRPLAEEGRTGQREVAASGFAGDKDAKKHVI